MVLYITADQAPGGTPPTDLGSVVTTTLLGGPEEAAIVRDQERARAYFAGVEEHASDPPYMVRLPGRAEPINLVRPTRSEVWGNLVLVYGAEGLGLIEKLSAERVMFLNAMQYIDLAHAYVQQHVRVAAVTWREVTQLFPFGVRSKVFYGTCSHSKSDVQHLLAHHGLPLLERLYKSPDTTMGAFERLSPQPFSRAKRDEGRTYVLKNPKGLEDENIVVSQNDVVSTGHVAYGEDLSTGFGVAHSPLRPKNPIHLEKVHAVVWTGDRVGAAHAAVLPGGELLLYLPRGSSLNLVIHGQYREHGARTRPGYLGCRAARSAQGQYTFQPWCSGREFLYLPLEGEGVEGVSPYIAALSQDH